ncbi:unnamed protein product, partial [Rotaria sp. Silwood1]
MIVRSTFFKLITCGILIFGVAVLILNYISYHQNRDNFEFVDDSNAYVISNHDGDALIRIKADVKSNSKPAILYANDGKIRIPQVINLKNVDRTIIFFKVSLKKKIADDN